MRLRFLGGLAALAMTVTLAACGTPPTPQVPKPVEESAAPTATPSPTPSIVPTELKPGTNHNHAAAAYAYEAKDVQACLLVPQTPSTPDPTAAPDGTASPEASVTPTTRPSPGSTPSAAVAGTCPEGRKLVFLTLDDGPNDRITPRVLDALKQADAPATFFYVGNRTGLGGADPAIVKRTIAEGHAIDIHTYSHNYKELYPGGRGNADAILADRKKAVEAVRAVLGDGYAVSGYRYPGGHLSWQGLDGADRRLAEEGAYWIDWNAMNGDAEAVAPTSMEGQLALVQQTVRQSGNPNVVVLLMHDHLYADLTVQALPEIVKYFCQQGYEFGIIN